MAGDVVERVLAAHGQAMAVATDGPPDDVIEGIRNKAQYLDEGNHTVETRLVLGSACTTAARAVDQFVAALQLPYRAARGWLDLFDALGDRSVSLREIVIVADAADLLRHEEPELWYELAANLHARPRCLGGGWSTVVLIDMSFRWDQSRFGSAAAAEAAAVDGWRNR